MVVFQHEAARRTDKLEFSRRQQFVKTPISVYFRVNSNRSFTSYAIGLLSQTVWLPHFVNMRLATLDLRHISHVVFQVRSKFCIYSFPNYSKTTKTLFSKSWKKSKNHQVLKVIKFDFIQKQETQFDQSDPSWLDILPSFWLSIWWCRIRRSVHTFAAAHVRLVASLTESCFLSIFNRLVEAFRNKTEVKKTVFRKIKKTNFNFKKNNFEKIKSF